MTIFVIFSHYFAEIDGGLAQAGIGFVGVDGFFVLSGLLVGRLILDKGEAANFYQVFYVRRICRTFPIYFLCVALALAGGAALDLPENDSVPGWSYFAFVSNIFAALQDDVGRPWLSPTWTMAVEEQFYLVAPALMLATPRHRLLGVLAGIVVAAILIRLALHAYGANSITSLILLPTRADNLAIGLACAVLLKTSVRWNSTICRAAPIVLLFAIVPLKLAGGLEAVVIVGHTIVCVAVGFFLLGLIDGAPEARRFENRTLIFFGETSYATYLTHLPVLWCAHTLILQERPSLSSAAGVAVTLACIPITVGVAFLLTRFIEAPITAAGRRMRWDFSARGQRQSVTA